MADVRGQRVDLPLVAVEPDRVVAAAVVDPEVAVEALLQGSRPRSAAARRAPDPPAARRPARRAAASRRRHSPAARRSRSAGAGSCRRRTGRRPTSRASTGCRGPASSGSGTRRTRRRRGRRTRRSSSSAARALSLSETTRSASPVHRQYSESRMSHSIVASARAVVRAVRLQPEHGQLAEPELVQDPARLLVLEVVGLRALEGGERQQRPSGEARAEATDWYAVISVSRPNRVRNHGRPAAGRTIVLGLRLHLDPQREQVAGGLGHDLCRAGANRSPASGSAPATG